MSFSGILRLMLDLLEFAGFAQAGVENNEWYARETREK
jgi:hypothetical protein